MWKEFINTCLCISGIFAVRDIFGIEIALAIILLLLYIEYTVGIDYEDEA